MAQQHTFDLYRFYDAGGRLLYVGISLSTVQRMMQHCDTQPWWPQVTRAEFEHLTTTNRREAERAERRAVIVERPVHNIVWNGRRSAEWLSGPGAVEVNPDDLTHGAAPELIARARETLGHVRGYCGHSGSPRPLDPDRPVCPICARISMQIRNARHATGWT